MSEIRRLAIFCGSNPGTRPQYVEAARSLGRLLAERGIGIVYGGSSVGLMAALADAMMDVIQNPALREALVAGGHEYADRQSWDKRKGEYLELVDSLSTEIFQKE